MQVQATDFTTELLQRIKNAESAAFAELYDHYSCMLYGILYRIVEDEEESQHLLQDCFVKIRADINSFDETKERFATWLINIARNTAIDFVRSPFFEQKQKNLVSKQHILQVDTNHISQLNIEQIISHKILEHITPSYRQVIDWMYFEGYTQQEISAKFKLPLETVKSRARAAMLELRNYVEQKKIMNDDTR